MYKEILTKEQEDLLSLVEKFSPEFGLVGGTAIALHLGHRRSIDFDLFTNTAFKNSAIKKKVSKHQAIQEVFTDENGQFTFFVNGVKMTFFEYLFPIDFSEKFESVIRMPDLLTLGAMKAYALGRRAKWKDYVDIYFIAKKHNGLDGIVKRAREIFKGEFNEKIFRVQLAYFEDIDRGEKMEYMDGFSVSDEVIKKELIRFSVL